MNDRFKERISKNGRVLRFDRDSGFLLRRADGKRQRNDPVSAASLYWSALEKDPKDHEIRLALADVLSDMQRYLDSNHVLIPHMHEDEWFMKEAYGRIGFNFFAMGEYAAAQRCFTRFLDLTDEVSDRTDAMLDALDNIVSSIEEPTVVDSSETMIIGVMTQAHECIAKNDFARAKELLSSLHSSYPEDERVTYNLALACMCDKDYKNGLDALDELGADGVDSLQLLSLKLIYAHNVNDELMTQSVCNRLEKCDPNFADELLPVMGILFEEGRTELAMKLAKRVYVKTPYDCTANHLLALCFAKSGQPKKAVGLYSKLLNICRPDYVARFYLNKCSGSDKDLKDIVSDPNVRYQLPLYDIMENVKQLASLSSLSVEELCEKWRSDINFRDVVRWGFTLGEFDLSYSLLNLLGLIRDEDAQQIIRGAIIDPGTNHNLAHEAMGLLKHLNAPEPYFTFGGGTILEGRVSLIDLSEMHLPFAYRSIFPRFRALASGLYDIEVYAAASGIMESFLSHYEGKFPQLDEDRSTALSAALEFIACKNTGAVCKDDLLERYNVTERRLRNAINKMLTVLTKRGDEED